MSQHFSQFLFRVLSCSLLLIPLGATMTPLSSLASVMVRPLTDRHEKKDIFSLLPELNLYSSVENFDQAGNSVQPTGLVNYFRANTDVPILWGITEKWTLFGRISWSYVAIEDLAASSNSFGFTDQQLGTNYRIAKFQNGMAVDLQISIDLPTYTTIVSSVELTPILGDGTTDITLAGFLEIPILVQKAKNLHVIAGLGYTSRSESFQALLPWSIEARYRSGDAGFFANALFFGMFSTASPEFAQRGNPCINGFAGGGSCYIGSTQPSQMSAQAKIGYAVSRQLGVHAQIARTFWGKAAPQGIWGGAGVDFHLGASLDGGPETAAKKSPKEYGRSNRGFVTYSFEAKVQRVNDRFNLIKINRGSKSGVNVGQIYDIFSVRKNGKIKEAVARARVTSVKREEAALKITEYFREVWIEEGFIVKRPLD